MKTVLIVDEGRDTLPFNFNNVDVFNFKKKVFLGDGYHMHGSYLTGRVWNTYAMSTERMHIVFLRTAKFILRFVSSLHLPEQWDRALNCYYKHIVCFGFFVSLENFSLMETSPLPVKSCKFWHMLGTHGHSLACNTYCDTGHPFIMVISEDP